MSPQTKQFVMTSMFSLRQPVQRMAGYLPEELVSSHAIKEIETAVDWFPAAITNTICFELELKKNSSSSDFSFICRRGEPGLEIFAGRSEILLPEELFADQVWRQVRNFCQDWLEPQSEIWESIMYLWVELDMPQQQRVPSPVIFLGIPKNRCTDVNWILPVFEVLNYPVSHRFLDILQRSFRFAASATKGFEIALMFSRKTDMARFVFHGVNQEISALLTDLGIVEVSALNKIMTDLLALEAHVTVDIDAGDSVGPKIGLECQFSGNVRQDQPRWNRALDYLVSLGCCTSIKRDALLRWPGGTNEKLKHLLLPVQAIRKINNYKIVWQQDAPIQAKAYLLARYF
jgi:hypothetical protein